jgi:hypothetical protein
MKWGGPEGPTPDHASGQHEGNPVPPSAEVIGWHVTSHLRTCGSDQADGWLTRVCPDVDLVGCACGRPLVWLISRDATCRHAVAARHGRWAA